MGRRKYTWDTIKHWKYGDGCIFDYGCTKISKSSSGETALSYLYYLLEDEIVTAEVIFHKRGAETIERINSYYLRELSSTIDFATSYAKHAHHNSTTNRKFDYLGYKFFTTEESRVLPFYKNNPDNDNEEYPYCYAEGLVRQSSPTFTIWVDTKRYEMEEGIKFTKRLLRFIEIAHVKKTAEEKLKSIHGKLIDDKKWINEAQY